MRGLGLLSFFISMIHSDSLNFQKRKQLLKVLSHMNYLLGLDIIVARLLNRKTICSN